MRLSSRDRRTCPVCGRSQAPVRGVEAALHCAVYNNNPFYVVTRHRRPAPSAPKLSSVPQAATPDSPGPSDPASSRAQLEGVDRRAQARAGGRPARVRRGAAGQIQLPCRRCRRGHHMQAVGQTELVPGAAHSRVGLLKVPHSASRGIPALAVSWSGTCYAWSTTIMQSLLQLFKYIGLAHEVHQRTSARKAARRGVMQHDCQCGCAALLPDHEPGAARRYMVRGACSTTPTRVPVSRGGCDTTAALAASRRAPRGSSSRAASSALPHWLMSVSCACRPEG